MSSMEGKKVPKVTFRTRQGDKWVDVTTSELFLITGRIHSNLLIITLTTLQRISASIQKIRCRRYSRCICK